jgi:fused signal recognition particle receptor
MSEEKTGKKWWGATVGKLRDALARTKEAVVDAVLERGSDDRAADVAADPNLLKNTTQPISTPVASIEYADATPIHRTAQSVAESPAAIKSFQSDTRSTKVSPRPIDNDYLEDLEEKLIRADLGVSAVDQMISDLRKQSKSKDWTSDDLEAFLKHEFEQMLASTLTAQLTIKSGLNIILVVGVNGTGKTTSIGKLCHRLHSEGKQVLMAAADTFRAAAETQLEIWAERAGVSIVRLPDKSDPGAVVFQAIKKAKEENFDVVVIDTAGRLHNKANLMAELKKVRSVIDKNAADANLESLLVLDASTGQNGLQQAKVFTEAVGLTGVILTKLDGSAKGGVVFAIAQELKIPVKLIGLGEKIDDLRDFEPELFIEALF